MGLFDDIEPVPFRLLDELQAQMDANRERINIQQELKGLTRPRPQRSIFNATMSSYRRPEPAAHPRALNDLSVFWLYYGSDGRLWIANGNGQGGWRYVARYFEPYPEEDFPSFFGYNNFVDYFLSRRAFYEGLPEWDAGTQDKLWSPEYGSKGPYGEWYRYMQTQALGFAIAENVTLNPRQLHVGFNKVGESVAENTVNLHWCATGQGAVAGINYTYMYFAQSESVADVVVEQRPFDAAGQTKSLRFWSGLVTQNSAGPVFENDYTAHVVRPSALENRSLTMEQVGLTQSASADLAPASHVVDLPNVAYDTTILATNKDGWPLGSDIEPPINTWADEGWPERRFQEYQYKPGIFYDHDTIRESYQEINPFQQMAFRDVWNENEQDDAGTVAQLRNDGVLTGGGPYTYPTVAATRQDPVWAEGAGGNLAQLGIGFDFSPFLEWAFFDTGNQIGIQFADPTYLNYRISIDDAAEGDNIVPLIPPDWLWAPDLAAGAFAADVSEADDALVAINMLRSADVGPLRFLRSDGQAEAVRIAGPPLAMPPTDTPEESGAAQMLISTNWGQVSKVRSLARRYNLT